MDTSTISTKCAEALKALGLTLRIDQKTAHFNTIEAVDANGTRFTLSIQQTN